MYGITKESLQNAENIVLMVTGGLGRNVMATAVVRNIKQAYPDKRIIVLGGAPDVFLKNPHIYRTYSLQNPLYFYDDFIKENRSVFINVEPYQHYDYIAKRKHFVECWCDMIGVPCDSVYPEMFYTQAEHDLAISYLNEFDKDMVLCQFEGGKVPDSKGDKDKLIAKGAMYRRSLPEDTQLTIVEGLQQRGYHVGIVAHENQYRPGGSTTAKIFFPTRAVVLLTQHVAEVMAIDSFVQHGAAVFKKKSLVLWAGTSPIVLGYDCHQNLRRDVCETPECHRPNSFLMDIEVSGFQWECPWSNRCTDEYSADAILAAFDEMTGGKGGKKREYQPVNRTTAAPGINPYAKPLAVEPGSVDGQACPTHPAPGRVAAKV